MASITRYGAIGRRVFIRRPGHRPLTKTFTGRDALNQAKIWAREQESRLDRGEAMGGAALRVTFGEMVETYRQEITGRMGRSKDASLTHVGKHLGEFRLGELRPRAFLDFAQRREREGAGPATILMDLSYIGTVLRHAAVLLDAAAPAAQALIALESARTTLRHAGRVRAPRKRSRRPTDEELGRLKAYWDARPRMNVPMWDLTLFAIATAMRLGEIVRIDWEGFDPRGRTQLIRDRKDPHQKEGNDQRVPLLTGPTIILNEVINPVAVMGRQRTALSEMGRVFPFSAATVSTLFTRAVKACKIPDLNFHDLRHDGTSRLFEAGYTIEQVATVTGHKSWANLKRYTNLRPESLHRA